jgi:hypothetical protein
MMKIYNLADTFGKLYPELKWFSWWQNNPLKQASILSHIYQHENELKHYFIKYKACIVHFLENAAH